MSTSEVRAKGRIGARPETITCPDCGKRNSAESAFCTECGQRLDAEVSQTNFADTDSSAGLGSKVSAWVQSAEDLAYGQMVIIAARWVLVVAGLGLALWNPNELGELRIQIGLILALAVGNFFLHAQVLMKRPVISGVVHLASAIDIAVITAIVVVAGGFTSGLYVFYFPAIFAISVAFNPRTGLVLAAAAIGLYGLVSAPEASGDLGAVLVTRMIMMAAVVACGMAYWKIERDRRSDTEEAVVGIDTNS